jgi:hypothetical protein
VDHKCRRLTRIIHRVVVAVVEKPVQKLIVAEPPTLPASSQAGFGQIRSKCNVNFVAGHRREGVAFPVPASTLSGNEGIQPIAGYQMIRQRH